ncbi:MAG: class I SAM-dependent methyltransferase [Omnitrophica bacterium]|nr:class I SAM-dependent methyltransferase [Candidatus Omnitrophota bacterium]
MKRKQYGYVRPDFLSLVPKDAKKILDVGCEKGLFGKQLKQLNNEIEIIGVEKDEDKYNVATKNLDRVILGDIEEIKLPFKENYFDCIIAGDVLEHLVNPWKTLEHLRYFLKEDGFFISSVPNISHYKVLMKLLRGRWDYTAQGILDKTHLRFFCLDNIKEMFQEARFEIEGIRRNMVSARGLRILNLLLFNRLTEFLTQQYYIIAQKKK